jgi:NTP pyrophosphatase (non-canonical NTP hydrolase)
MHINELFAKNLSRCYRWHGERGVHDWSALEWAAAMCGEAGEAANAAKKLKRLETSMQTINEPGRHYFTLEEARTAVAKEVADTIIYGLLLMARVGIADPEAIIREVYNKKSEEYGFPEKV